MLRPEPRLATNTFYSYQIAKRGNWWTEKHGEYPSTLTLRRGDWSEELRTDRLYRPRSGRQP